MKRIAFYAAVTVGVWLLAAGLFYGERRVEQWLERRGAARQELQRLRVDNARLIREARDWQLQREAFAAQQARRDTVIRERIVRVQAAPVPEDCLPFTAPRDSIIRDQQDVIVQVQQLWADERAHSASLLAGLEQVQPVIDTADAVLKDAPVRRTFWQALLPKPGAQVTLGVDTKGKARLVAGAGLQWSF